MKRILAAFAVVTLLVGPAYAASGAAQVTPEDIAAADARRRAAAAELTEATAEYDAAVAKSVSIQDQLRVLATELAVAERNLVDLRIAATDVTRAMYMEAGATGAATVLDAETINEIPVKEGYLDRLSSDGAQTLARLEAVEAAHAEQSSRLGELQTEQAVTVDELEELADSILTQLAAADADYSGLVAAFEAQEAARLRAEEEARRRAAEEAARMATSTTAAPGNVTTTTAGGGGDDDGGGDVTTTSGPPTTPPPPPPPKAGRVCPVNGAVSFTDTWGASRSGGRAHQGVDMIAARGTPLVAIESGTVRLSSNTLGGISLYLSGSSGDTFYYAHMDGYASGLSSGQSVSAGQAVGTVGNTGNAQYTVPHLHFEHHPGGGGAVNPTPLVSGLCR